METVITDGGRAAAGYKGTTGDCVTRAIAIATGKPYQEVYDALYSASMEFGATRRGRIAKAVVQRGGSPRNGVFRPVYDAYLASLGWTFTATMAIGQGCKVHLKTDELPQGKIIVRLSKHIAAVVDGVLHDTHDCSREGTRCVYGYYSKK